MKKGSSSSVKVKVKSERFISPKLTPNHELEAGVADRQERVPGFDQKAIENLTVAMIGAGGVGTEVGEALVRKGIGGLIIFDHDEVELSNLNRQKFYKADLYRNKAFCLAKNLREEGAMGTILIPHRTRFQEAVEDGALSSDVIICGADNNPTRAFATRYCLEKNLPAIFTGVSLDADHGYVMVQEPGGPCWGCALPDAAVDAEEPCPGSPAVKGVLKLMGAVISYTVDSLFMDRSRKWNYREIYLADPEFDRGGMVNKKKDCPICGGD